MKQLTGMAALAIGVLASGTAQAGTGRQIWLTNSCSHPVRMFMRWIDPVRGSLIGGSWEFKAYESNVKMLEGGSNGAVVIDDQSTIYIYAESTDNSSKFWQGSTNYVYNNVTYGMMSVPVSVKDGHFVLELTCPSSSTPPPPSSGSTVSQHP